MTTYRKLAVDLHAKFYQQGHSFEMAIRLAACQLQREFASYAGTVAFVRESVQS